MSRFPRPSSALNRRILLGIAASIVLTTASWFTLQDSFRAPTPERTIAITDRAYSLAISPSGQEFLVLCASNDHSIYSTPDFVSELWTFPNAVNGYRPEKTLSLPGIVQFSDCGKRLIALDYYRQSPVRLFDLKSHAQEFASQGASPSWIWAAGSKDGRWLAARDEEGSVSIWDLNEKTPPRIIRPQIEEYTLLFANCGSERLLAIGEKECELWDLNEARPAGSLLFGEVSASDADHAVTPDGSRLARMTFDGRVGVWDIQSGKQLVAFRAHRSFGQGFGKSICFFAGGDVVVTHGSYEKYQLARADRFPFVQMNTVPCHQIRAWNARTGSCIQTWNRPKPIAAICPIPGARSFASLGAMDQHIDIWQVP